MRCTSIFACLKEVQRLHIGCCTSIHVMLHLFLFNIFASLKEVQRLHFGCYTSINIILHLFLMDIEKSIIFLKFAENVFGTVLYFSLLVFDSSEILLLLPREYSACSSDKICDNTPIFVASDSSFNSCRTYGIPGSTCRNMTFRKMIRFSPSMGSRF